MIQTPPEELVDLHLVSGRHRSRRRRLRHIFDADILGYFMNGGDNKEKGNLGYASVCRQSRPPRLRRRTSGSGRSP